MPLSAPKPVDALRQHTRAVVLIAADGHAAPALLDAIRDSEIPCELIGHPLVAMAELVRLEQDNRQGTERTALVVADDERIEQLSSLFQAVRSRMPQVAIWVIAGDFAVQVQRPQPQRPEPARDRPAMEMPPRTTTRGQPQLRIVDPMADADPTDDAPAHARDAKPRSILAEVKPGDTHRAKAMDDTAHDGRPIPRHLGEAANDAGSAGTTDSDDGDFDDAPSDAAKHSTKLTAEELDMLLGWNDDETSSDAARGGGDR